MATANVQELKAQLNSYRHEVFLARTFDTKEKYKRLELETRDRIRESIQTTLSTPNTDLIEGCKQTIAKLKDELQDYLEPKIELQQVTEQHDLFEAKEEVLREVDVNEKPRKRILDEIGRAERAIATEEAKVRQAGTTELDMLALAVSKWDPYDQNACSDFFDADWMFNVRDGFDIIIGNPPYVQLQKNHGAYAQKYRDCAYSVFSSSGDMYNLFAERATQLTCEHGTISLIIPNKWMLAESGEAMRKFMLGFRVRQIMNFGDVQFFDNAATIVCILIFSKEPPSPNCMALSVNQRTFSGHFDLTVANELKLYSTLTFTDEHWLIIDAAQQSILKKLTENSQKLRSLDLQINYGVKTGMNDAFIISKDTATALSRDKESKKHIFPMLRGRDICEFSSNFSEQYLIGTFPSQNLDIDKLRAIRKHLLSFGKNRLEQSGKKYRLPDGKCYSARKKSSFKWFETQDSISYWKDFSKPKIIYPEITSRFQFSYDEKGLFCNNKAFIIVSEDSELLKLLTGIFNSSITKLWIWHHCPELMGGTREIRKVFFENFPVPILPSEIRERIVSIVNAIIEKKEADSNAEIESDKRKIDDILADFYELSNDEKIALQAFVNFLPGLASDDFELCAETDEGSDSQRGPASIPLQPSSELEDDFIE